VRCGFRRSRSGRPFEGGRRELSCPRECTCSRALRGSRLGSASDAMLQLAVLATARLLGAATNIVHDCDEVYNYWEPLHYLLHGFGMQTWEYRCATTVVLSHRSDALTAAADRRSNTLPACVRIRALKTLDWSRGVARSSHCARTCTSCCTRPWRARPLCSWAAARASSLFSTLCARHCLCCARGSSGASCGAIPSQQSPLALLTRDAPHSRPPRT